MSGAFFMMMAAGGVAEQPIEGQTGVWLKAGGVTVSSAMKMTGAVVSSGQKQYVFDRGVADTSIISSGGSMEAHSGGLARHCIAETGGSLTVGSGASALDVNTPGGRTNNYGVVSGAIVSATGTYFNYSNGVTSDITLTSGGKGYMQLAPSTAGGGVIHNLTLTGAARLFAQASGGGVSGGVCNGEGNIAANIIYVNNGAFADDVVLMSAAQLRVSSGGIGHRERCDAAGQIFVYAGGLVVSPTLLSGGTLYVNSGASALAVTSNAGAVVTVAEGGYIEYTNVGPVDGETGVWLKNRYTHAVISSGMSMDTLDVAVGQDLTVYNSGYVDSVLMPVGGGALGPYIHSGGTINYLQVSSGGYASAIFVSGGKINSAYVADCNSPVISGPGSVGELTLDGNSSGNLNLGGGVNISKFTNATGGAIIRAANISEACAVSDTINARESCVISNLIVSSGGTLIVSSGGTVYSADLKDGAKLTSSAGGYVSGYGVLWFDAGYTVISSAQQLSTVSLGSKHVLWACASGSVGTVTLPTSASAVVMSGGRVDYLTGVQGNIGVGIRVSSGGYIESFYASNLSFGVLRGDNGSIGAMTTISKVNTISGMNIGHLIQSTGGGNSLCSATVGSADVYGNHLRLYDGGFLSAATVYNGGHLSAYAGGTALGVVISAGGDVVNAGGYIEYVTS